MAKQQAVVPPMKWHEANPDRWQMEQGIARQILLDCNTGIDEQGVAYIEGVFRLESKHGHIYDSIKLRIEYPAEFPTESDPAKVIVLSHRDRWIRSPDAHLQSDWSLCLFVPVESKIDFRKDDSLNALFGVLRTFLFKEWKYQKEVFGEMITNKKPVWLGPARAHGLDGILEALGVTRKPRVKNLCYCGSGKPSHECHKQSAGDNEQRRNSNRAAG
jgi:hypothetical protein